MSLACVSAWTIRGRARKAAPVRSLAAMEGLSALTGHSRSRRNGKGADGSGLCQVNDQDDYSGDGEQ